MEAIEKAALMRICQPIESARGIPNEYYTSAPHFAAERDAVLFAGWAGLGFGKDVPNAGDMAPVEFLGVPLLIVRDRKDAVRVFQNVCRHRGRVLVDEPCKAAANLIRCPYHSWAYKLNGDLVATPHIGGPGVNEDERFDKADFGLIEIRSFIWRDVVFINMSGEAEPFETHHENLIERWRIFDQPIHHGGTESSFSLEVQTNWKLAVENFCESYHLPFIHPGLNTYSRLEDHYDIVEPGRFSGQGTWVYQQIVGAKEERFPDHQDLPEKWDKCGEYVSLFPNVLFGVHRDHSFAIVLNPVAPDRTVERVELYYADKDVRSDGWRELRQSNANLWRQVFEEDITSIEGMQRGRRGVKFDGGKFAPAMDAPTHCFHEWFARNLLADAGQ